MKKFLTAILVVLLTAFLAACGNGNEESQNQDKEGQEQNQDQNQGKDNKKDQDKKDNAKNTDEMPDDKVVAKVNGVEITNAELKQSEKYFKQQYQMLGQDPSKFKDQIQKQALDNLINLELVKQSAEEAGIKPSEEEVNKKFNETMDRLKKQSKKDNIDEILKKYKTTKEEVKEDIRVNLMTQKYIEQEVEVPAPTKEELQKAYDSYKKRMENNSKAEPKSFEEMKEQLKQQVKSQKKSKQTQKLLENLRKENEVKVLI